MRIYLFSFQTKINKIITYMLQNESVPSACACDTCTFQIIYIICHICMQKFELEARSLYLKLKMIVSLIWCTIQYKHTQYVSKICYYF